MYKKLLNLNRRNFNKFISLSLVSIFSFNILFFNEIFSKTLSKKNSKIKWVLSEKDR